jgi:hypothetical protein
LERIDPKRTTWKSEKYENLYGYKRPLDKSPEAYKVSFYPLNFFVNFEHLKLLAKIEKESSPDQILAKRIREEKKRQEGITRASLNRF